jgi:hypothetical protein
MKKKTKFFIKKKNFQAKILNIFIKKIIFNKILH